MADIVALAGTAKEIQEIRDRATLRYKKINKKKVRSGQAAYRKRRGAYDKHQLDAQKSQGMIAAHHSFCMRKCIDCSSPFESTHPWGIEVEWCDACYVVKLDAQHRNLLVPKHKHGKDEA